MTPVLEQAPSNAEDVTEADVDRLACDLMDLGLRRGDIVFARAATTAVLPGRRGIAVGLREAILRAIGPTGTVVTPTFTAWQLRPNSVPRTVFTPTSPTIAGGFAAAILSHKQRVRSEHPINSIAAIGPHAGELTAGHDEHAHAHAWMERLVGLGGKQLVVGCVASSPGLGTIHFAQERLGLTTQSLLVGHEGTFVRRPDGREEWVTRTDSPGCSLGFHRMYGAYVREGILRTGHVGHAYSIMALAADTFAIDMRALAANPRCVLCERASCLSCSTRTYNLRALPRYLLARAVANLAPCNARLKRYLSSR